MFAKLSRTPSLTLHIEVSKGTWQGTLGSSQNSLCGNCTFRFDVASKNEAPDACWEPKIVFFELVRSWSLAIGRRSAGPVAFACIDREFCGHFAVRTKLKDSCPAQLPWNGTKQKVFCNLLAKYPSDPTVRYSIPGLKQLIKFHYIQSMWWTLDIYIHTYIDRYSIWKKCMWIYRFMNWHCFSKQTQTRDRHDLAFHPLHP